ncbi:GFA family protein [Agaribacter marinus]|uniref:ADP-ribosylglycohydrolase n=1 Tax=Agaribacter marinus TaxID=1431249 RepID=A0AA37WH57_9ALTE|nr:GFA family protein [Agaribacter marinus]GLR69633.1 ADP-ribosylglycohydrolase [Agaribacter marinus]
MKILKGGCLCGAVEYEIKDDLIYSGYCHCSECRRWTGAPFSSTGGVKASDFKLNKGKSLLASFSKGENSTSYFCTKCSSNLYGEVPEYNMTYVMLGTLSQEPTLAPQWHIYTGSKVEWFKITDNLPQYQEGLIKA